MSSAETGIPETPQAENVGLLQDIRDLFDKHRNLGRIAGVALALGGGGALAGLAGSNSSSEASAQNYPPVPTLVSSKLQAEQNCQNITSANSANNVSLYSTEAFMPDYQASNPDQAKKYVFDLFGGNGPLAGKADIESVAAALSVVGDASHQGGFENTNYDYLSHFNADLGLLNKSLNSGDKSIAVNKCNELLNTLVQDVGYTSDWARPGETITEFAAQRDKNFNIVGANLLTGTAKYVMKGVEFKMRDTSKGENGYLSVFISTDTQGIANGTIFIKGLSKVQIFGKSPKQVGKLPQRSKPQFKQLPNGTATAFNGTIISTSVNKTGVGNGLGVNSSPAAPENLPNGPNSGQGTGPSHAGGPPQSRPGPGNSPGGGGGGGGPTSTPNTIPTPPPTTTTETTPPPTTVTTTPPPPPTTTTSTTPTTPPPIKPPSPGQPGA